MNDKEKLYEQYEDAFFALLMGEIAEAEGEKLVEKNKQLQSDPCAAVPEAISKRCLKAIVRNYQKTRRKKTAHTFARVLNRIAVVAVVVCLLFVGVLAVSETARVNTLNYLIDHLDVGTAFLINSENTAPEKTSNRYLSEIEKVIPDGFLLELCDEDSISDSYLFRDSDGSEIEITDYRLSYISGTIVIDTENAAVRYETLHGQEVMIVHKETTDQIVWINDNEQVMTIVRGSNTPIDALLPIAESIILSQE